MKARTNDIYVTPVKKYAPPKYPTQKEAARAPELLRKLPSRWEKNAAVVAAVGMLGIATLSSCGISKLNNTGELAGEQDAIGEIEGIDESDEMFILMGEPAVAVFTSEQEPTGDVLIDIPTIAQALFSDADETLTFDDILKSISEGNMTSELIDKSQTEAKISAGDDIYYTVYSNPNREIKISALDTFVRILNNCAYIKVASLNEPVLYTLVFHASDIDGNNAEICVYVTHSSIRLAYNGVFEDMDMEYINIADSENCEYNMKYCNVSAGYDLYIAGVIPDENGQRATIW